MESIPYSGQIKIGDTTSFRVGDEMVAVEVYAIGWDTVDIRSLDLKRTWTILKGKWLQQVAIIMCNSTG